MTALALDVGGTKMAAARVLPDGSPDHRVTVPTPQSGVWDACGALLERAAGGEPITSVGIASAGPVDTTAGTVAPVNIAEWRDGFPIVDGRPDAVPGPQPCVSRWTGPPPLWPSTDWAPAEALPTCWALSSRPGSAAA